MLAWILIPCVTLILGWGLLEWACRLYLGRKGRFYAWAPKTRFELTLDPMVFPKLDRIARLEVNSLGERGQEPPAPDSDAWHTLVIGDSIAECYMSDQETQLGHRIQVELNRPEALQTLGTSQVHTGNLGRSLMPCVDMHSLLEKVFDNYDRVDQIIMMVGASDVVSWLHQGAPESYTPKKPGIWTIFRSHPLGPFSWLPPKSAARRVIVQWWRSTFAPIKRVENVGKTMAHKRSVRQAGKIVQELPDPTEMLARFRTNYRRLIELVATKTDRLCLVRNPWFDRDVTQEELRWFWNYWIGEPAPGQQRRYLDYDLARKVLGMMDQITMEVAEEMDLPWVETRSKLDHDFDTFYDENHLTPKGCEDLARIIAQGVLEQADQTGTLTPKAQENKSVLAAPEPAPKEPDRPERRIQA